MYYATFNDETVECTSLSQVRDFMADRYDKMLLAVVDSYVTDDKGNEYLCRMDFKLIKLIENKA